jgi:two-component sensor histidine kinase
MTADRASTLTRDDAGSIPPWHVVFRWAFLAANVIGVAFIAQSAFLQAARGGAPPLWRIAVGQLLPWYGWALLAPLIVVLCAKLPLRQGKRGRTIALYAAAAAALAIVHSALMTPVAVWLTRFDGSPTSPGTYFRALLSNRAAPDLVQVALLVAVCHAVLYYRASRDRELAASRLTSQLAQAELKALKLQLQPHFLFNTLNAIAAHIRDEPAIAEQMVERLSELLRLVLHSSGEQEVTLARELEFVRTYLGIHEVRFGSRLRVSLDVDPSLDDVLVPAMLLQPLVENAVVHGIASRPGEGAINVRAWPDGTRFTLTIEDSGTATARTSSPSFGVGLSNTQARLAQLYGRDQSLTVSTREGGTLVALVLPIHR